MNKKSNEETTGKRRIFIVDDHPLVREGLANLINEQEDLTVCGEAEDAAQALAGIGMTRPDLALIDISLKTASGLELVKDLKVHHPNVALIVLSMHDEMLYAERAIRAGAKGYVMKREALDIIAGPTFCAARDDDIAAFRLDEFDATGIREGFFGGVDDLDQRSMGAGGG